MPYARKRKVYRKKPMRKSVRRTANRKRRSYRTSPGGMIGFPTSRVVKLRYAVNFVMDSAGSPAPLNFSLISANNINSPANSSVDPMLLRPLGYDQWKVFYRNFVVVGSKCKFTATYDSTTAGGKAINVGILLRDNSSQLIAQDTIASLITQGKAKWRTLQPVNNGNLVRLSQSFSPKKWFNITNIKDNYEDLGGVLAATESPVSPTKQCNYMIWVMPADASTDIQPVNFTCTVDYLVLLSDQRILSNSLQ